MRIDTKIDKIIESLKETNNLKDAIFTQHLGIIRNNLKVIESAKNQMDEDSRKNNVQYGFNTYRKQTIAHPGIKMIQSAEKTIMSCFRQLGVKPEVSKKEVMTPLMQLQKHMDANRNQ